MNASASGAGQPRHRISIDYPYALGEEGWLRIQRVADTLRTLAMLSEPTISGIAPDVAPHDYAPLLWLLAEAAQDALADRITTEALA